MSLVRVALTETRNVFPDMPASLDRVADLSGRGEEIRAANVAHHLELIAEAAQHGARVIGLGELFTGPYFALHRHAVWRELAEDAIDGPTTTALRAEAERQGVVIVAPLYELDSDSGQRFNTAVVIDADGSLLGRFRKMHIPEGSNERATFDETFYYERSSGDSRTWSANISENPFFPVFATSAGRIGVAICYDRHFEGVVRSLAQNGAQLVLSPAVTFGVQSRRIWEHEFLVDAARHSVFIGGSNRRGSEPPFDVEFFGASYLCGPQGRIPTLPSRPELVIGDVDLELAGTADGSGWDLPRDARPDTYS